MIKSKILAIVMVIGIIASMWLAHIAYQYGWQCGDSYGFSDGCGYKAEEYAAFGYSVGEEAGYILGAKDGYHDGYYEGWDRGENSAVSILCPSGPTSPPTSLYIGSPVEVSNPSWAQLRGFLYMDRTEDLIYSDDFNCWGFAIAMKRHAQEHGIRCAIVSMTYRDTIDDKPVAGHVINMFEVVDPPQEALYGQGHWWLVDGSPRVYVDAQNERIVYDIEVGGSYKWYVDFSGFKRNDGMMEYSYYKRYGTWGDLSGRVRAINDGVEYVEPSKYRGNDEDIKEYERGPFIKAHDSIVKMVVIW